jgi:hypothetical protein
MEGQGFGGLLLTQRYSWIMVKLAGYSAGEGKRIREGGRLDSN